MIGSSGFDSRVRVSRKWIGHLVTSPSSYRTEVSLPSSWAGGGAKFWVRFPGPRIKEMDWSSSGRITALHAVHAGSIPVQSIQDLT